MRESDNRSLFSIHLWDLRASLESQLRYLTRIQKSLTEYRQTTHRDEQMRVRTQILSDLRDIEVLSFTVPSTLQATIAEAETELALA